MLRPWRLRNRPGLQATGYRLLPGSALSLALSGQFFLSLALCVLGACTALPGRKVPAEAHRITGSLAYRERIALPPDAVATVRLLDISIADRPATPIAEQTTATAGRQVPLPFELTVEAHGMTPGRRYGLRGTIANRDGLLLWTP